VIHEFGHCYAPVSPPSQRCTELPIKPEFPTLHVPEPARPGVNTLPPWDTLSRLDAVLAPKQVGQIHMGLVWMSRRQFVADSLRDCMQGAESASACSVTHQYMWFLAFSHMPAGLLYMPPPVLHYIASHQQL
jgi:hypothetical protein